MGYIQYGQDNNDFLPPYFNTPYFFQALSSGSAPQTFQLIYPAYTPQKEIFYCSNAPEGMIHTADYLWSYGGITYCWLGGPNTYVPNAPQRLSNTPSSPLMTDKTQSSGANHIKNKPMGGNILYLDGHALWKNTQEMTLHQYFYW
jgi:prepilin-type processing-associated H-X9-DG protein